MRIALDSVGVERSSFDLVSRLPLCEIKVARSIVRQIYASHGPALVGAILGLGKGLGVNCVADGVEDRLTWERLRSMGFDLVQGSRLPAAPSRGSRRLDRLRRRLSAVPAS